MKKETIILYGGFLGISIASMCISKTGQHIASGLLLLLGAIFLYGYFYKKTKNLVNYRGLLSLAFVGGEGIAAFQLSNLQTEWSRMTWLCFAAFYLSFLIGYDYKEYRDKPDSILLPVFCYYWERFFYMVIFIRKRRIL